MAGQWARGVRRKDLHKWLEGEHVYGGGGLILSRALVARLVPHMLGCMSRQRHVGAGDERIGAHFWEFCLSTDMAGLLLCCKLEMQFDHFNGRADMCAEFLTGSAVSVF